jgi:predicted transcriptional regulator
MSYDLLRSAKHIRGLSNAEFRVLFYLLEAARSDTNTCFPSIKKIATFTDMAERTVQRHITALADRGLFERIEQRRNDGSRMVNCYRFVVAGTIRIGRESVIQIEPEDHEADVEQPANNGGLTNPPVLTPPPVNTDTTPRQDWRDIDKESEPGISPQESSTLEPPVEKDLLGEPVLTAEQEEAARQGRLIQFVDTAWADARRRYPMMVASTVTPRRQKLVIKRGDIGAWAKAFAAIEASPFLQGNSPAGKDRSQPFVVSMDWLLKAANFDKVVEGTYSDKRALSSGYDANSGRKLTAVEQASRHVIAGIRESRARRGFGGDRGGADGGAPLLTDGRAR